jgi:hypothetical protein
LGGFYEMAYRLIADFHFHCSLTLRLVKSWEIAMALKWAAGIQATLKWI